MTRVVEHLENLIRIASPSSLSNRPVIEYAEQVLHAAGWQTLRNTYVGNAGVEKINLLAVPPGQSVEDRDVHTAFFCHTDTVPYAPAWSGALTPETRAGFLHGCGACDVKGFLACLLASAESADPKTLANVRIVLTADEEIGCIGAKQLLAANLLRPRHLVIGEPTSLHPARAGKGYCLGRITVTGKEAHSAHPERGASAINAAAHLLIGLEELARDLTSHSNAFFTPPFTTLNIGTIQGGTAKNIIPGTCSFQVEWRPIPGPSPVPGAIATVIERQRIAHPQVGYAFTIEREQQGFETPADSPLVRTFESLTGKPAVAIPFGSEASLFLTVCDDIVVFGPGDMTSAHSDRECVEIAQLHHAVTCLHALMLEH
jgi:acetylornithine deacetylase